MAKKARAATAQSQGFGGFDVNNMTPQQMQFMASCAQAAMMTQNQMLQGQMPGRAWAREILNIDSSISRQGEGAGAGI